MFLSTSTSSTHDSHRTLSHSRSEASILSRSAADGLLAGLSIRDPSGNSYLSSSRQRSSIPPPRPPRSPPMDGRRVVSNPPPLPTTLPTARVVPIIPGLGYHLAQRRAAEVNAANQRNPPVLPALSGGTTALGVANPSPTSQYSHACDETSSESDECPPTVSDNAGSVRPTTNPSTPDQWQAPEDNYESPVWASRWSRRASEATSAGTAGGSVVPEAIERRPSYYAFMAARQRRDSHTSSAGNGSAGWGEPLGRRRSSQGSLMRRPSSAGSMNRRRSSAQHPNFPFPFPAGGARRDAKVSLFDNLNGAGPSAYSRRESAISIRSSDDGDEQDAWDDLADPDAAALSRRSSYDSSFAFDHGRRNSVYGSEYDTFEAHSSYKRRTSHESVTFGSLPPRQRNSSQGSLLAYAIHGRARRASSIVTNGGGLMVERRESWQSAAGLMISGCRRQDRNMSIDSIGEVERIRRFGGMTELNRRESEVLEVEWRMSERREVPDAQENAWASQQHWQQTAAAQQGASRWSPSTVATDMFSPVQADAPGLTSSPESSSDESATFSPNLASDLRTQYIQSAASYDEMAYNPSAFVDATPSPTSTHAALPSTEQIGSRHRPQLSLTFSFEEARSAATSPRPEDNIEDLSSPGQLLAAMLAECAPNSSGEDDSPAGSDLDLESAPAEITHARRIGLSPVTLQGRGFPWSAPSAGQSRRSSTEELAYLSRSIRVVSNSPTLEEMNGTSPVAPAAAPRARPPMVHSQTAPYGQRLKTFDRMAAFLETSSAGANEQVESPLTKPARPELNRAPSKTTYRDPLDRRSSDEIEAPSLMRARSSTMASGWASPWVSESGPLTPPPVEVLNRPRRDASTHHLHRKMVAPELASPIASPPTTKPHPPRPSITKKISTASLPPGLGTLPFEHTFLQRARAERPSLPRSAVSHAQFPTQSHYLATPGPCDASAVSPETGLCFCGGLSPYGAPAPEGKRMSKPPRPTGHYAYPVMATPRVPSGSQQVDPQARMSMPVRGKEVEKGLGAVKPTRTTVPGGVLGRWLKGAAGHRKTASQGTV